jgi:hypothetical protein
MEEPRKIVLILGNGFDLDLGLKTSYKDFWESKSCPKDYPAPLISHLNNHWPNNLEKVKWYDLENELYYYAKGFASQPPYEDVITEEERKFLKDKNIRFLLYDSDYSNLVASLHKKNIVVYNGGHLEIPYLEDLLKSSDVRDSIALGKIKQGLCEYIKEVSKQRIRTDSVASNVILALEKMAVIGEHVEVFTFNYTPVLFRDDILDNKIPVYHMHGQCNEDSIIIGTRDDTEIDKKYAFMQKAMDPAFNPPHLVRSLHDADELIIFGHSIGENDRQYFKAFFKQQTDYSHAKSKDITIFTKDESSEFQIKLALQNMTDGNLSTLFSQNNVQIIKTEDLGKDQNLLFNFLIKHHTSKHFAEDVINKIYSQQAKKEEDSHQ